MAPISLADLVDSPGPATPSTVMSNDTNGFGPNGHPVNGNLTNGHSAVPNGHHAADDKSASPEPIAIIGMGCRLPGGSSSSAKLWDLLAAGRSAQKRFPASRFNIDGFYHANGGDRPGSLNTEGGYFIDEDIRAFENSFFGINNLEATYMDPQQRKLLEVVFECFENAGVSLEDVSGANIGCYVGNFVTDFITMQLKDSEYTHRYTATGLGTTILANRVSHVFNLRGPSFVIDTACSSSLYCLHAACTALQSGECDAAVVAGANLIQSPEQQLATMKAGVLSKTSTCHTFDTSADGYGRADGIGALLVKRLSDAIRDGDAVRAVIRGTAVNSNGKTNGITLPSADGQEAVIRKAYAQAGLGYGETDYVECHGTGTAVGDPIEVEALSRVFRRPTGSPLLVGSVKTNLGHSEAASGISSIIKVVLALEKGQIPPTVGVTNINPKIKVDDWNIHIVTEMTPWPQGAPHNADRRLRRAGVNSFGYGGANAHAIIEAAEVHLPSGYTHQTAAAGDAAAVPRTLMLLPVSGSSDAALKRRVADLSALDLDRVPIADLAYTLGVRRSHLASRGFVLARPGSLKEDLVSDNTRTQLTTKSYAKLPLAFVFTGQGAQWPEMGRELMDEFPSFRRTIQRLDAALQLLPHPPTWTLRGALLEPAKTSMINHASRSQPVCTAVQVALVRLLSSWGIKPESVVGHSSGEIAAAYAAGYISAEQAITVAYYRGYTVTRSAMVGAMMAAGLGRADADKEISALGLVGKIRVACVNSPESVTISGDVGGIDALKARLDKLGVFARLLKTDGKAYHSHHMAAIGQEYQDLVSAALAADDGSAAKDEFDSAPSSAAAVEVRWISSVTEEVVVDGAVGPAYWRANLESPVLFSNVVEKLLVESGPHHLVEIGPHSALELPIKQIRAKLGKDLSDDKVPYGSALSRGKNSVVTLLSLTGDLYLHGHAVSFGNVNLVESWPPKPRVPGALKRHGRLLPDLPNYAWNYDSHVFHEPRVSVEWRNRKYPRHDLLGSQVHGGNGIVTTWRNVLKAKDVPWVEGHKLDTTIVFPAAGYLAMAVEAMSQARDVVTEADQDTSVLKLRNVEITKALVLPDEGPDAGVELFTTLQPAQLPGRGTAETDWYLFNISSYARSEATTHAKGLIRLDIDTVAAADRALELRLPVVPEDMEPSAPRTWYNKFAKGGLNFQGQFQSLTQINVHRQRKAMHVLAETELRQGGSSGGTAPTESTYMIHPITIDALFQAGIIAGTSGRVRELAAKVPVHIEEMTLRPPPLADRRGEAWNIKAVSEPVGFGTIRVAGELYDSKGRAVLQVGRCRLVAYQSGGGPQDATAVSERHPMLRVLWKPDVARLNSSDGAEFSSYIEQHAARAVPNHPSGLEIAAARLGAALDLLAHKNPRLRVLSLLGSDASNEYLAQILRLTTAFKRCQSLWQGSYAEDGSIQFQEYQSASSDSDTSPSTQSSSNGDGLVFDVVVLGSREPTTAARADDLATIRKDLISDNGTVLCIGSSDDVASLESLGFATLQSQIGGESTQTILARLLPEEGSDDKKKKKKTAAAAGEVLIVERNANHGLNSALAAQVSRVTGRPAKRVALEQVTPALLGAHATTITTIELEEPVLSRVTEDEMRLIKTLTDHCTNLIWVTGGSLFRGTKPELAVVFGLSRALMLEQPSLRFFVVDVDVAAADAPATTVNIETTARHIAEVFQQAIEEPEPDFEFVQAGGMLHVSRFAPEEAMNRVFREKQGAEKMALPLSEARPCRLGTEVVGQADSIFFRREDSAEAPLATGYVEVSVRAVGLDARDLRAISGDADSSSDSACTSQYGGVIARVGAGVKSLAPGDRVVVMAPGYFATRERVAEWACHKINDNEKFTSVVCLPLPLSTAIYAIHDRARLQAGESILVCCGNSSSSSDTADLAAVRVAQLVGAQVFAVTATQDDRERLIRDFRLPGDHVFVANDATMAAGLLQATGDRGLDVIVAFADKLPIAAAGSIGTVCADCARLVQVGGGQARLVDAIAVDPTVFRKNVTVTTFDIGNLITLQTPSGEKTRRKLLTDAMDLYRRGDLDMDLSPQVLDISQVGDAFRAIASRAHLGGGRVVVSLEDETSSVPVLPVKYDTVFSAEKSYLLVGCLGGLGRSMSKWMLARGARKFVFLGRSGTDRAPARRLVEDLQLSGAQVTVVRGDVVNYDDVQRAVSSIDGPVGGVIQAAMGLDEALFATMPREYWLTGLRPKVTGSWNLHNALRGRDEALDFFLMTSSVSGSVGTATESNYCSANYFLDVFARYRRRLGLPAVSVGLGMISEVGYLHENPEIEALLLRKGIQAINEDEMLQIIDIALSMPHNGLPGSSGAGAGAGGASYGYGHYMYDELALGHVLTGLEPLGLKELRAKGFEGTSPVLGDPRASLLSAALDEETAGAGSANGGSTSGLPAEVAQAIESGSSVEDAVLKMMAKKFSNLVLIPEDKLNVGKPISDVGVDSMLAAEFRAWIFQAFKIDVPYLTLLSSAATLTMLSEMIVKKMTETNESA